MLSREMREAYRRMSNAERLKLTLKMNRSATAFLLKGSPEQIDRKFELIRRENDARNLNMLKSIARTRDAHEGRR